MPRIFCIHSYFIHPWQSAIIDMAIISIVWQCSWMSSTNCGKLSSMCDIPHNDNKGSYSFIKVLSWLRLPLMTSNQKYLFSLFFFKICKCKSQLPHTLLLLFHTKTESATTAHKNPHGKKDHTSGQQHPHPGSISPRVTWWMGSSFGGNFFLSANVGSREDRGYLPQGAHLSHAHIFCWLIA